MGAALCVTDGSHQGFKGDGFAGASQVDTVNKSMVLSWQVTAATLASGAASSGRGATTEIFAPIQGFFAVARAEDLVIQVCCPFSGSHMA